MKSERASAGEPPKTNDCKTYRSSANFVNRLWFFGVIFFLGTAFYATHNYARIRRFESQLLSANLAVRKHELVITNRIRKRAIGEEVRLMDEEDLFVVEEEMKEPMYPQYGGPSYIRWGRKDCPDKSLTRLVYQGLAAGTHYSHTGGGADYMCIYGNITYDAGKYIDGGQGSSHVYGVEFRDGSWVHNLFNISEIENNVVQYHSLPCAVCIPEVRTNQIMIPGRDTCPNGWEKEYTGYIMAGGHSDTHTSKFICVDENLQVVHGTHTKENGAYLFMVETQCNSLLCEPFVAGRELRCVVCTV